jgi:hypothetical protein
MSDIGGLEAVRRFPAFLSRYDCDIPLSVLFSRSVLFNYAPRWASSKVTMASFFRFCSLSILVSLVAAQGQFKNPKDTKDLSQTFSNGDTVNVEWNKGWFGYGKPPDFADLFLVSWNSDEYIELINGMRLDSVVAYRRQ